MTARVRADQLDLATRRRLGITARTRTRPAPSRAGTGLTAPSPGTCPHGRRFESAGQWERHAKRDGCSRFDLQVEIEAEPEAMP